MINGLGLLLKITKLLTCDVATTTPPSAATASPACFVLCGVLVQTSLCVVVVLSPCLPKLKVNLLVLTLADPCEVCHATGVLLPEFFFFSSSEELLDRLPEAFEEVANRLEDATEMDVEIHIEILLHHDRL